MIYISNCVHRLHQGYILLDVINNVKIDIYLAQIILIS